MLSLSNTGSYEKYSTKRPDAFELPVVKAERSSGTLPVARQREVATPTAMGRAGLTEPSKSLTKTAYVSPASFGETTWSTDEWDGVVTGITRSAFKAILGKVRAKPGVMTESVSYSLDLLSDSERTNLVVGAIFRLAAGLTRKQNGSIVPQMSIYFRPASRVQHLRAAQFADEWTAFFASAVEANDV